MCPIYIRTAMCTNIYVLWMLCCNINSLIQLAVVKADISAISVMFHHQIYILMICFTFFSSRSVIYIWLMDMVIDHFSLQLNSIMFFDVIGSKICYFVLCVRVCCSEIGLFSLFLQYVQYLHIYNLSPSIIIPHGIISKASKVGSPCMSKWIRNLPTKEAISSFYEGCCFTVGALIKHENISSIMAHVGGVAVNGIILIVLQ